MSFCSPWDSPDPGVEPTSPALQVDSLPRAVRKTLLAPCRRPQVPVCCGKTDNQEAGQRGHQDRPSQTSDLNGMGRAILLFPLMPDIVVLVGLIEEAASESPSEGLLPSLV